MCRAVFYKRMTSCAAVFYCFDKHYSHLYRIPFLLPSIETFAQLNKQFYMIGSQCLRYCQENLIIQNLCLNSNTNHIQLCAQPYVSLTFVILGCFLFPVTTSMIITPKLYISDLLEDFPCKRYSGAQYPLYENSIYQHTMAYDSQETKCHK